MITTVMNPKIKKANTEKFSYIKGDNTGANYRFYDFMYAVLEPDHSSPLSCVSVANNSLSIDLWTGCAYQCAYCHVQGVREDIDETNGRMRTRPVKRNHFSIDEIIDALIEHPFFKKDRTIISIGTSSTEPLAKGDVLESTLEIMENFINRGLKNPFWIVTKAGIPNEAVDRLINISREVSKLILSMCWANNSKEIEPAQNNRFKNIDKLDGNPNISVNWYLRPFAREWIQDMSKLETMFQEVAGKYAKYIDSIVPGGLRWTEGIEYGLVESRGLPLPNISKENNTKTLTDEDWIKFVELSQKYFPDKPVYYHSSCALSLALNRSNVNLINLTKKKDCNKSICPFNQRNKCTFKNDINEATIQNELDKVGFGLTVLNFNRENGSLNTSPEVATLSPALQTELSHIISDLNQ